MSYFLILILLVILSIVLYFLSFLKNKESLQKSDSFECGFNSLSNPSLPFNMPFFFISLMFLVFDLEVALLIFFPLMNNESSMMLLSTMVTLLLILLMTIYEWEKNLINWF